MLKCFVAILEMLRLWLHCVVWGYWDTVRSVVIRTTGIYAIATSKDFWVFSMSMVYLGYVIQIALYYNWALYLYNNIAFCPKQVGVG